MATTKTLGSNSAARRTGAKPATKAAAKPAASVVETAQEARSAEPGPSILALLTVSTVAAIFVLGIVWFIFFRT